MAQRKAPTPLQQKLDSQRITSTTKKDSEYLKEIILIKDKSNLLKRIFFLNKKVHK